MHRDIAQDLATVHPISDLRAVSLIKEMATAYTPDDLETGETVGRHDLIRSQQLVDRSLLEAENAFATR
jgi:hypothetical protein